MSVKNAGSCLKITLTASIGGAHLAPVAFRQPGPYQSPNPSRPHQDQLDIRAAKLPVASSAPKELFHPVIDLV
jgi:hypothetical protein